MLHGLGGDSGQLWPYAGRDAARCRLAPDLRAHGATLLVGQRRSFTFGGLTRDLAALLDRLRFPPSVVVGMSMGAGVAASLALRQPFRVRGLVLDAGPPANLRPLIQAGRLLRRHGARAGLARFVETAEYGRVLEQSPAAAASLVAQFHAPHAVRRSIRLTALPRSTPLGQVRDLRRISVPTVVVGAPSDPPHPFEIARIWASALPVSRLVTAPARDADPAGYQACLTEACGQLAGQVDEERQSAHDY
jgi:pimeloyl-ACP methyl ester carboxylesterase